MLPSSSSTRSRPEAEQEYRVISSTFQEHSGIFSAYAPAVVLSGNGRRRGPGHGRAGDPAGPKRCVRPGQGIDFVGNDRETDEQGKADTDALREGATAPRGSRSEERRVGKECVSR